MKSILDIAATLERLETLSVPVLGYRTDAMPGFYVRDAGLPVPWRVDSPEEVADVMRARDALRAAAGAGGRAAGRRRPTRWTPALHERTLADGLAEVERRGITGKDVTPFLLGWFHEHTGRCEPGGERRAGARERGARGRGGGGLRRRSSAPDRERLTARGRS